MADPLDHKRALQRALAAGDTEAAALIRQAMAAEAPENIPGSMASMLSPLQKHYSALQRAMAGGDEEVAGLIRGEIDKEVSAMRQADVASTRPTERFAAGVGGGMSNVANNVRDILGSALSGSPGADALRPDPAAWAEERTLSKPLYDTTAGLLGKVAGETAALTPAGRAISAGTKALEGGAGLASRLLGGPLAAPTLEGGAQGYILSDDPESRGKNALVGATLGNTLARLLGGGSRAATGLVKPSAAGKYLREMGADDLTIGQLTPESAFAQIEQAGQSVAGAGPILSGQRQAGQEAWQDLVFRQAGEEVGGRKTGTLGERLKSLYEKMGSAYDDVRASPLSSRAEARPTNIPRLKKALALASKDPDILSTEAEAAGVAKYLANQASMAERKGVASPEVLMQMRSNIREQIRSLQPGDARIEMLRRAEESIDNRLRYALPAEALEKLRATDAQYGKYKTVEKTVAKAKDSPSGFTPNQLSNALIEGTGRGAYARGGGGEFRRLAAAGREALDTTSPPTGARAVTMQIPVLKHVLAGGAALANTQTLKRALLGDYAAQKAIARAQQALEQKGLAEPLRRLLETATVGAAVGD